MTKPSPSVCRRRTVRKMSRDAAQFLGADLAGQTLASLMPVVHDDALPVQLLIGETKSGKTLAADADSIIGRSYKYCEILLSLIWGYQTKIAPEDFFFPSNSLSLLPSCCYPLNHLHILNLIYVAIYIHILTISKIKRHT